MHNLTKISVVSQSVFVIYCSPRLTCMTDIQEDDLYDQRG